MLLNFLHSIPCISSTSTSGISSISAKNRFTSSTVFGQSQPTSATLRNIFEKILGRSHENEFFLWSGIDFLSNPDNWRQAPVPVLAEHGVNGLVRDTYALPLQTAGYLPWRPLLVSICSKAYGFQISGNDKIVNLCSLWRDLMCFPALFSYICHQYYQMHTSYETSSLICVVVCVGTAFVQFHPDNHF